MPSLRTLLLALAMLLGCTTVFAEKIIGAATCASSQCHMADEPSPFSQVKQTEFYDWLDSPHSRSEAVLRSPAAKAIAKRFGVSTSSNSCVSCHAYESHHQLKSKSVTEGITCEACHGSGSFWLPQHVSVSSSHARNISHGMNKLEQPSVRAAVCSDCHQPRGNPRMPHQLYASGHPRLSFELVTDSAETSNHYQIDNDYLVRKGQPKHAEIWRAGQLIAANTQLKSLQATLANRDALFPELSVFECDSCHRPANGPSTKIATPSISTAQLNMALLSLSDVEPEVSQKLLLDIQGLSALSHNQPAKAAVLAEKIGNTVARLNQQYADQTLQPENVASCIVSHAETHIVDAEWMLLAIKAIDILSLDNHLSDGGSMPLFSDSLASLYSQIQISSNTSDATTLARKFASTIREKWPLAPCQQ